ncbi:hypothetical protein H0A61_01347 [Koleobacter methoxysyntrophicus]|uniref:RNA-binding protein n=1 Tax=Koleobacter methoxysyntrophicus TaxID=2751313 RepID=A0A8A0RN12_9FIRM|nr:KOW domain-containing RNA-binding protein [Koleobacter methoxysyntrophicus]NPV44230.1 RNA-binding protein [Bacillota bacterium]QSQ08990.1 hypothetical protein H0A61_01347 [Koleobacter methoxysyntrophicus]
MAIGISPGQIVYSKAGRDKDRYFIIIDIVDDQHVMIADGDLRRVEKPKKKKIKHIKKTDFVVQELKEKLEAGKPIKNSEVRKALEEYV